jgi:lipopolysaccharide transport system permease protein
MNSSLPTKKIGGPKPYRTIRPESGWGTLDWRELLRFRDLLITLAARDVKLRYRQTALGAIWVILQPLLGAGIFSFVFGKVAKLPTDGVPYFVFAYAGLLGWNAFLGTFTKASSSLVQNSQMISKVYFPRLILPFSTLFSTLLDFAVALALLPLLMWSAGVSFGPQIVTLPLWVLLLVLLATGAGLFSAALMVSYRDVQYALPVLTAFLLYASPVGYAVSAVPEKYLDVYFLNPIAGLLAGFRWSLLGTDAVAPGVVIYAAIASVVVFFAGAVVFGRLEARFADVI